jgi:hypothetical protein
MVRLGGLLKSGSSLFKSAGKGGLGNLGSGFANKIKFRPTKPKLKIKKQPKIKTTKPKTPDTKKAKELKKTPVDKVKQADNLKAAKKTGPLNKMKTMSKNGLRKARTACRKNPVKCGGALALAGYTTATYFQNTEEQRKCIMKCIPANWNEYINNMCIGLYWEGANGPPLGGTDVSEEVIIKNIRNHTYRRGAPDDEPYIDVTSFTGTRSNMLVDLTENQMAPGFGNLPFDTSYVMVDGICFVPSVRYQKMVDGEPHCPEKSRDELIARANVYRCGGNPCDTCKSECESKHPTTPAGVMGEAARNLTKDIAGFGLDLAGFDENVLTYIGYGIGVIICILSKKILDGLFSGFRRTALGVWLVFVAVVIEYYLGRSLWCQFSNNSPPPWAKDCKTTISPIVKAIKKDILKKRDDEDHNSSCGTST